MPDDVACLLGEFIELEDTLSAKKETPIELEAAAIEVSRKADGAEALLEHQQTNADGIAQSRSRGDALDSFIETLNAGVLTSAVARLGLLGAISCDAQRSIESISKLSALAESSRSEGIVGKYLGNGQVVIVSTYGVPVQIDTVDSIPIAGASHY